jgi:hypothetical protein
MKMFEMLGPSTAKKTIHKICSNPKQTVSEDFKALFLNNSTNQIGSQDGFFYATFSNRLFSLQLIDHSAKVFSPQQDLMSNKQIKKLKKSISFISFFDILSSCLYI